MILVKIFFMIIMAIYGVWGAFNPDAFWFINGVNLLFHEAGHVFFGFFGEYVGIWGGTLFQFLFPAGLGIAFLVKKDKFAASIMFFWMAQNLVPISIYIKDARAQALQYVGGEIHDWFYILSRAGLLEKDQTVGAIVCGVGLVAMVLSCVFGIYSLIKTPEKLSS